MIQLIPLATSIVTVCGMWLAGNKNVWGWYLGVANQALWLTFIIAFEAWGLLPLLVTLLFVYTRNVVRWKRSETSDDCTGCHSTGSVLSHVEHGYMCWKPCPACVDA